MTRRFFVLAALALTMTARPAAHQLDEYLQAARIAWDRDRIVVEIDLTPGVQVAGAVLTALDRDADGVVVTPEARAYGEAVVGDLELTIDRHPVQLRLDAIDVPPADDMRRGVGTMQLKASGTLEGVPHGTGTRHLRFTNHHLPGISVYLANALVPVDRGMSVVAQKRDARQQRLEIEYAVGSARAGQLVWVLFGGAVIMSAIASRRKRGH